MHYCTLSFIIINRQVRDTMLVTVFLFSLPPRIGRGYIWCTKTGCIIIRSIGVDPALIFYYSNNNNNNNISKSEIITETYTSCISRRSRGSSENCTRYQLHSYSSLFEKVKNLSSARRRPTLADCIFSHFYFFFPPFSLSSHDSFTLLLFVLRVIASGLSCIIFFYSWTHTYYRIIKYFVVQFKINFGYDLTRACI